MTSEDSKLNEVLPSASEVYVLMSNAYRISRNFRAQWFYKNINKNVTFKWKKTQDECFNEIEIISAIPINGKIHVEPDTNTSTIKIVADTKIHFLSSQYRLAFCLDLSSSVSTVDIQHDDIFYSEIFSSLVQSLTCICSPFLVPGSDYLYVPQLYITVVAHIPNCASTTPQVLVQGWKLTHSNVNILLELLRTRLDYMCQLLEKILTPSNNNQIQYMLPMGNSIDSSIDGNRLLKKIPDLSADVSTFKIIRYGILALQLLPENSSAGVIVVTDGILSFPNCKSLDSLLNQLRNSTIACSFLQLGSPFHNFSCFGQVPYKELMEFIATATCGTCFPACKSFEIPESNAMEMNAYHKALLIWNFQKSAFNPCFLEAYKPSSTQKDFWHVENPHFYTVIHQSRMRKKHTEGTLKVSLENLLSCRLREGYSVKNVYLDEGKNTTEIKMILPWMLSTNVEYIITSAPGRQWKNTDIQTCHFEVIVDGCYEFLHDVTCSKKKPIQSTYRKNIISQFWSYIKNLSNTDQILTQLHSFAMNSVYYTIPENIKNGVPLFYIPPNSTIPILSAKNVANILFTSFWKTLCMLDINVWQKWMHAHRIGILLQHDSPLQKNLHLPNASGRFTHVQCRQATTALNSLLSENGSFVLVENHSYIKLLFDDPDKPPVSFYVIRVTSKPPCVVIRVAFLGGLPGLQRYKIVNELREKISNLKLPKRSGVKNYSQCSSADKSPNSSETSCCFLLKKPVEKVLIRYEKLPTNFLSSNCDTQTIAKGIPFYQKNQDLNLYADTLSTLSKYLMQQRWIWTLQYEACVSLDLKSASQILYALTNVRLQEGFHFSHSSFGIIYMVQEIPMQISQVISSNSAQDSNDTENSCCIVQYIIFPPHTNTTVKDSISEEDDTELTEADGELQLISECWVEPQYGTTDVSPNLAHLNGLKFDQISQAIHKKDLDIVQVLTTFEHLCMLCRRKTANPLIPDSVGNTCHKYLIPHANVAVSPLHKMLEEQTATSVIPYAFNFMSLLPKCPQVEVLFSTLHEVQNDPNALYINNFLFEFLIENLKNNHDQEIPVTPEDCVHFLFHLHHRKYNNNCPPITLPHPSLAFFQLCHQHYSSLFCSNCPTCKNVESSNTPTSPKHKLLQNLQNRIPRWRCFVKGYLKSHIVITVVPATYEDLKKLHSIDLDDDLIDENKSTSLPELEDDVESSIPSHEAASKPVSLILPMYVYDGILSSVISKVIQLELSPKINDSCQSHLFECECCSPKHSTPSSSKLLPESMESPKKGIFKEHCSLLEKAYSKAFAYGMYRSLMLGATVYRDDAVAAIDEICEESLVEIDITEFVFMICGHVKDFFTKRSMLQMQQSQSKTLDNSNLYDEFEISKTTEKDSDLTTFPLSKLDKYQPCKELHQKHLSIKENFSAIIKCFFKVISSRPEYFFFCPTEEDILEDDSVLHDGEDSQEDDDVSENVIPLESDTVEGDPDKASNVYEEEGSCLNTNSSLSSIDKDTEPSSLQEKCSFPPLMVHFSCSVRKSKQDMRSCPLTSLPTCLSDMLDCLDPESPDICLEDLKITFDMFCLTVPSDIENLSALRYRACSTSFSSNSPIPEAEGYRNQVVKDEENDSICSDIASDTIQGNSLINLPSYQKERVFKCIDRIKWLLQDEKASVALNCFPVTTQILNMVVEHVESSEDKSSCVIKEIPLMFVYGSEKSLSKFTQAFKNMNLEGYYLEQVDDLYYLVMGNAAVRKKSSDVKTQRLGFIPASPNAGELKRLSLDTDENSETEFPAQKQDSAEVKSDVFIPNQDDKDVHQDADVETEDGFEDQRPRAKQRKTSLKRLQASSIVAVKKTLHSHFWETERKTSARRAGLEGGDKRDELSIEDYHTEIHPMEESSPDVSLDSKMMHVTSNCDSTSSVKAMDTDFAMRLFFDAEKVHSSNTEDGYEGDSSDSGSEYEFINSLKTKRPSKFWLIMKISEDKVIVYFHTRHKAEDDPELIQIKSVMSEVATIISLICKEVNQVLLLTSLYENKMCDRLLVPEENEDLWKGNDRSLTNDDPEYTVEVQEKYLEATLKFNPGEFSCRIVWVTHFKLHHRLIYHGSHGNHKSFGNVALRKVLQTLSVNNRENMFVYRERSGGVFYLRLFEENCDVDHCKPEDGISLMERYSSNQSLLIKPPLNEYDLDSDFRPRVNSGASDSYRQDSISTTSLSRKAQKCVALYVHGVGEAGTSIKQDLVQALQNRLNESVLDQIDMILSRNPSSMLTPEDVQFIQNTNNEPSHELFFTLPVKLLGHTHSIHMYLRQNLLHFLYNPKYMDTRKESHFKAFWDDPGEWTYISDNDVFLYHSQQVLGRSGKKGISSIGLCFVTGQRKPFRNLENLAPNPSDYLDGLSESEYEDLTSTSVYTFKNDRTPGPVALIRFQIWSVGKDNRELIEKQLKNAVQHSLWDLIMEYRALTCPVSESVIMDDSACCSEPTTPIRTRRSGIVNVESNIQTKDLLSTVRLHSSKEISTSVPDITTKIHSPSPLSKDIPAFKFSNKPQSAKPDFSTPTPIQNDQLTPPQASKYDKRNLNYLFCSSMKDFLEFGVNLGCPSLFKWPKKLHSRHCINFVLKEAIKIMSSLLRDVTPKVYKRVSDDSENDAEYAPFDSNESVNSYDMQENRPGTSRSFITVGRNEKQWRAYMGLSDFSRYQESNLENTYQKYFSHTCDHQNTNFVFPDSMPSSPTFTSKSSMASISPNFKTSYSCESTTTLSFVPRQRLLLLYLQDKEITLYLYNFSQDTTNKLVDHLLKLTKWHHHRNSLLNNIVLQKLGIFHGLSSFQRPEVEKPSKDSATKVVSRESVEEPVPATINYIEQLIRCHTFNRDTHSRTSAANLKTAAFFGKNLKNSRPRVPFHLSASANIPDPVKAHGLQFLEMVTPHGRDMQVLYNLWQTRGSNLNEKFEKDLKKLARLSLYCFTPILFSPSWRYKVAPIRDHALDSLEQLCTLERPIETLVSTRSRHSSGSSIKNSDTSVSTGNIGRTRRASGLAGYPGSNQGSPKLRTKTPSEETWHTTVCQSYLHEYIQYLHTVGFISLQTSETSGKRRSIGGEEDRVYSNSDSFSRHRNCGQPSYLIKKLLGGLLVFELGLSDPYAYINLYSLACSRFKACSPREFNPQFTLPFLDELDKVKLNINLHSFTYDHHLRTIHSYISGRQLIFRHGYHLSSFLDDFIKYYQKAPNRARNFVYSGTLTISDINISGNQLYNYIISHNKLYGMTVYRMVPIILDASCNIDTEFALVELSARRASYKDSNDVCQVGSFDVGTLINQNITELTMDANSLVLNFYVILTSQRDLYPKLSNFGVTLGSFQTVRIGSSFTNSGLSSRKTSTVSMITERERLFESSGEESIASNDSRSKKSSVVRGMCDEDVMYLGYFSSQETMMQQVLEQEAAAAQRHLSDIVQQASVHCRRDSLWSSLLPRSLKEDNSSKEHSSYTFSEFSELLKLVSVVPLDNLDAKLMPYMNMHISWYSTLAPLLKAKYADSHREFLSADGNSLYVVVTKSNCSDCFMLLVIDTRNNKTELCLVFREEPIDMEHSEEKPNQHLLALQSLVEGFVNACCFHLWSCILPQ